MYLKGCTIKKTEQDEGGNGQDDLISESKIGMKNSKKYLKMLWEWGGSPILF